MLTSTLLLPYAVRLSVRSIPLQQLLRQSDKFPRFRQKLEGVGGLFRGPIFVDDPDFNVFNHVHVRRLPEPAGKRELDELVGAAQSLMMSVERRLTTAWRTRVTGRRVHRGGMGSLHAVVGYHSRGELPW